MIVCRTIILIAVFAIFLPSATGAEPQVYFGVLHSHTSYSDGSGTPEQAFTCARDEGHCDFFAITEHNHKAAGKIASDHSLYEGPQKAALIPTAERFTQDGQFVALYGQEFSTLSSGNHVNVFDVPAVIGTPNGKFDLLLDWINGHPDSAGQPAIIQLNHPGEGKISKEYGKDDFATQAEWVQQMGRYSCLMEVVNGPSHDPGTGFRPDLIAEMEYLEYLALGFHLAPAAGQDNHFANWGTVTDARTAVLADKLTKPNLLEAIRARHVYATEDKNLKIWAKINDHLCGDRISPPAVGSAVQIDLRIEDPDEPDADYDVEVFAGTTDGKPAKVAHAFSASGNTPKDQWVTNSELAYTGRSTFYFIKLTQSGEEGARDSAWTAPVWFEQGTVAPSAPEGTSEDISQFVASKNSTIYHVSRECAATQKIKADNLLTGRDAMRGRDRHEDCPTR